MSAPTRQEIREHILIDGMPPDSRQLLDYDNPTSNVYLEADAEAGALKAYGFDLVEQFRVESLPSAATSSTHGLLTDWEAALRIPPPASAASSTDAGRQAAVTSRLREFGASTKDNIRAALVAITGSASAVTIHEHSRAALKTLRSYSFPTMTATAGNATGVVLAASDNAPASVAGAQLTYNISTGDQGDFSISILAPDAQTKTWRTEIIVDGADHVLFWPAFAGGRISGEWQVSIDNALGGVTDVQLDAASLFVEGIGRSALSGAEGLGANVFEWVASVAEDLAGANYSRALARELVQRWNPAHCRGYLVPYLNTGGIAAVFDGSYSILDGCVFS